MTASIAQNTWHVGLAQALAQLPGPAGAPFAQVHTHGTLAIEMYAPKSADLQQPHTRDEWYIVARGTSTFERDGQRVQVQAADYLFVPAYMPHRFIDFSADFAVWVGFYGPEGGERA
jgi:mannose-6-phosphate isomerase-like protein (cupin superfamily)